MPAEWPEQEGISDRREQLAGWWRLFGDEQLDQLVSCAFSNSPELAIARARISEARALRRVAAAPIFPQVSGDVNATRQRISPNTISDGFPVGGGQLTFDNYQAGFDATWEIDVFGRTRKDVEARSAEVCASVANYGDVMVTLTAEVARNYVEVRCFQKRLELARNNLESQKVAVEVTQARFEAGLTSGLDVAQAESLYASTRSLIPQLEQGLYEAIHRLSVLLGFEPDYLYCTLWEQKEIPLPPDEIPAGLPCDLLRRRPDVRASEWEIVAVNAEVGRAIADLFPRITLMGALGLAADSPRKLPWLSSRAWMLGGQLLQPIFEGGRLRAQVAVERARFDAAAAEYQRTVLVAMEEVRNAMVGYELERDRFEALVAAVEASRRSLDLSRELYSHGLVDFLNVVDAERDVLLLEDDLVRSLCDYVSDAIALYKALGGGWSCSSIVK